MPGADTSFYFPPTNGNYSVAVSLNGCSDTSDIRFIDINGISSVNANMLSIFPVPANDVLNLKWKDAASGYESIEVLDLRGRTMFTQAIEANTQQTAVKTSSLPAGSYLLKVNGKDNSIVKRFSVER
jgi:hypothetical protein